MAAPARPAGGTPAGPVGTNGAVPTPFDATGIVQLTDALLSDGFDDDQIGAIMGGNAIRLLSAALPPG